MTSYILTVHTGQAAPASMQQALSVNHPILAWSLVAAFFLIFGVLWVAAGIFGG